MNEARCPVCGFALAVPAWNEVGASDQICPSCGIHFGYDDAAGGSIDRRLDAYRAWRARWIKESMPWRSVASARPANWNPTAQLAAIGSNETSTEFHLDAFITQAGYVISLFSQRHGFTEPVTRVDRKVSTVTIAAKKGEIAIEVRYDYREDHIEVTLARLENGVVPEGYVLDAAGRRFRAHASELLRSRGVYDLGLKPPSSKERFDEKCHRVVARYLTLLEHHAPDVIEGSASLFDETMFGPGGGKLKAPPRT